MLTIISHQGKANPKSQDTISHPLGWPQLNKNRNQTKTPENNEFWQEYG